MGCAGRYKTGFVFPLSGHSLCMNIKCCLFSQAVWHSWNCAAKAFFLWDKNSRCETEASSLLADYFSYTYSMYSELLCLKPSVVIHVPESSELSALLSIEKTAAEFCLQKLLSTQIQLYGISRPKLETCKKYVLYEPCYSIHIVAVFLHVEDEDFAVLTFDSHCSPPSNLFPEDGQPGWGLRVSLKSAFSPSLKSQITFIKQRTMHHWCLFEH